MTSLANDHWGPILRQSLDKGDTCVAVVHQETIVGTAVFGKAEDEAEESLAAFHAIC